MSISAQGARRASTDLNSDPNTDDLMGESGRGLDYTDRDGSNLFLGLCWELRSLGVGDATNPGGDAGDAQTGDAPQSADSATDAADSGAC
jgi:hypothetical protein